MRVALNLKEGSWQVVVLPRLVVGRGGREAQDIQHLRGRNQLREHVEKVLLVYPLSVRETKRPGVVMGEYGKAASEGTTRRRMSERKGGSGKHEHTD